MTIGADVSRVSLRRLELTVNGEPRVLDVEPRTLLVHALRDGLGLTGAHIGCDTSQCGACTVLLGGRAVKSCSLLALQADGTEVTTIEGLAPLGELHPLQHAFVEHHGLQCGFCTPGMILTAVDLLARDSDPAEETIRRALRGNLCRCTGYDPIVEAIRAASGAMSPMIPASVEYVRPSSIEEALDALGEPEAKVLAGGQSLVPALKLRLARPSVLVDVGSLDLRGISRQKGEVRVGALTTWDDLLRSQELAGPGFAAVGECAAGIGDLQVRNVGTLGGGLAHADPASDMPAVALALGMQVRVRSAAGERTISADELFLGPFTTALEPGELITEVVVPEPPAGSGSAYVAVENPASGFAVAGAAALVLADGTSTVAVTGIGGRPFLTSSASSVTVPKYRAHLMDVVVRRATELARQRVQEGAS